MSEELTHYYKWDTYKANDIVLEDVDRTPFGEFIYNKNDRDYVLVVVLEYLNSEGKYQQDKHYLLKPKNISEQVFRTDIQLVKIMMLRKAFGEYIENEYICRNS